MRGPTTAYERLRENAAKVDTVFKFGRNASVGTSAEDIWHSGGLWTGFLTSASAVRIASGGNAADAAAGTGARAVRIEGVDANYAPVAEEVATAGASASAATTTEFLRVFRAYVLGVGSSGFNVGDVEIETTGGATLTVLPAEIGQSLLSFYTVPAGFTAALTSINVSVEGANAGCDIWILQRQVSDAGPLSSRGIVFYNLVDDTIVQPIQNPLLFPEKTDLWFRGAAASGTSAVSCAYELELYSEAL